MKLIVFITCLLFASVQGEIKERQFAFKKVGEMANGLQMGHIHTFLNLTELKRQHQDIGMLLSEADRLGENLKKTMRKAYEEEVTSILQQWKRGEQVLSLIRRWFGSSRMKRGVGSVLASFFGIGLSVYDTIEIQKLKTSVNKLEKNEEKMIEKIDENENMIATNSKNINFLNSTLTVMSWELLDLEEEIVLSGYLDNVREAVDEHLAVLARVEHALVDLQRGVFSSNLVSPKGLDKSIEGLKNLAQKKKNKILFRHMTDLFKCDVSYIANEKGIDVFVHVPIAKFEKLNVYEYLNLPHLVGKHLVNLEAKNQEKYLAVDNGMNFGIELKEEDIAKCKNLFSNFICPDILILKRSIEKTCLGAIMKGQALESESCVASLDVAEEKVLKLNKTSVVIFSKEDVVMTLNCEGSGHRMIQKKGRNQCT